MLSSHSIDVRKVRIARFAFIAILAAALLSACAATTERAERFIAQEEWMNAVLEYRKALRRDPGNVEFKSRLKQVELKAADYYYQQGMKKWELGNLDGAIVQFQQGLTAMPEHGKVNQIMRKALTQKEANSIYREGQRYLEAGKLGLAKQSFSRAIALDPDHEASGQALKEIVRQKKEKTTHGLALSSKSPITLNFRRTSLRTAFEFIAKSFGVNVIFDESVKSTPVTLFASKVTFEQAINLLLSTTKTFYKKVGSNTIIIAPDTKEKRGQYEDQLVRTYNLNVVRAKSMADIIKGVLALKNVIINEQLNTLIIRDTEDVLQLVEKLIKNNDRKPAELMLDVEILEVNRTKTEELGLDWGNIMKIDFPEVVTRAGSSFRDAVNAATITLPQMAFRFFKQDVEAKTLANPKIRVIHGKKAKIHIGDRVPLRSASISSGATGTVTTSFTYTDIGIRLTVEPIIHLDNSTTLKLGLEVSSLGQNLGTPDEPAFSIGTRNAETYMLLRDGETAILGGLIRDEERQNRIKVPGFGDIPLIGALFTSYDDEEVRTDVLLTITPRIIRAWDIPSKSDRTFYSGTATTYSTKPMFAYFDEKAEGDARPEIAVGKAAGASSPGSKTPGSPRSATALQKSVGTSPPTLTFSKPVYETTSGQEFTIELEGKNLHGVSELKIEVLYNPQLISFVRGEKGSAEIQSFKAKADSGKGLLTINVEKASNGKDGSTKLARLVMRGDKSGISYLVYRSPQLKVGKGKAVNVQVRASRVVVK